MQVGAVLFDTRSIQRYIYSGTKLKTNIGASFIVSNFFQDVLVGEVLKDMLEGRLDHTSWQEKAEKADTSEVENLPAGVDAYVAYIGGGNALILLRDPSAEKAREIVRRFTGILLTKYPGLKTGVAIGTIDLTHFQAGLTELYGKLKANQNEVYPVVNVPGTGLTLTCPVNGEVADGTWPVDGKDRDFSREVIAKLDIFRDAQGVIRRDFLQELSDEYEEDYQFPTDLSLLGQPEGNDYMAIVHIDGNNMGKKFSSAGTLPERSRLSWLIKKRTESSFRTLVSTILDDYRQEDARLRGMENGTVYRLPQPDREQGTGKTYLPIRPLILGGDDVTFICNAQLALRYTKRFMQAMQEGDPAADDTIDTCAGIAILPTSYPFFRGYELAEQACDEAKKKSRPFSERGEKSSWLDFIILHGEQAPTLSQVREQEYRGGFIADLHFGPYRVDTEYDYLTDSHHISHLEDCVRQLLAGDDRGKDGKHVVFPRNKAKELRFVMERGEHDITLFTEQLRHDGKQMPHVEGWEDYETSLWHRETDDDGQPVNRTPYVDAVELMDFYVPEVK